MNCILCGHEMSLRRCGYAAVPEGRLCHADDHSCYHRWTVYGARPSAEKIRSTWVNPRTAP